MDVERIGAAVEECLKHCRGSFYPLGEIAKYLAQLEADPTWSRYEIEAIEIRVHRMLNAIVSVSPPSRTQSPSDQP